MNERDFDKTPERKQRDVDTFPPEMEGAISRTKLTLLAKSFLTYPTFAPKLTACELKKPNQILRKYL